LNPLQLSSGVSEQQGTFERIEMTGQLVEWQFGESEADARAWMKSPAMLHAYVDFRSLETPAGQWHRVTVVTHRWVQRQVDEGSGGQSWPALLVVPDGTLETARAAIDRLLADGGWRIVALNSSLIRETDRLTPP
jgi:hypothetical protein